ncbi:MAG: hypothetical protein US89_C0002G0131 [Candidatus Peregrinibacteria bacterium GW2011_GWF2_38_29]|nr:MAG: hypothetical protein US89_C0002G0131 [Candidatus Peregrinibacteria bacterium GW2011_GWF2_38_29]HBB02286.1 hypothetical protein [Candidatus Peregrinibacteria bacterium]
MNKILRISVSVAVSLAILILNVVGFRYFALADNKKSDYEDNPSIIVIGEAGAVDYKKGGEGDFVKVASNQVLFENDIIKTGENVDASISFATGAIVRLNVNTEVQIKYSIDDEKYNIKLNSGGVWVNALIASSEMFVYFPDSEIHAIDSVVDVSVNNEGGVAYVSVNGGSVLIGKNNEFTFISQGDNVEKNWLESDWVKSNIKKDSYSRDSYAQSLKEKVQKSGISYNGGTYGFYSALTFNKEKLSKYYLSTISALIDDGAYYLSVDDRKSADDAFVLALEQARGLNESDLPVFQSLLFSKFNKFKSLVPKDGNIHLVREKIKELILIGPASSLLTVDEKIHLSRTYLYDALNANTTKESVSFMDAYFSNLLKFTKSNKSNFVQYVSDDNRIIYNAFLGHPEFYKKSYFDTKSELEKVLILAVEDVSKRSEIEQKIIGEKFELLRRLKEFVVQDKISTRDAFIIADFLKNDANVYISSLPNELGKNFVDELNKYSDFIAFLNDKRYESSVYGVTAGDRFISYINSERDKKQLDSLQKSILGEKPVASDSDNDNTEEIKKNVSKKLELYNIKVEEFGDVSGKYITIVKAVLDNVPFSAKYDIDYNMMSNIVIDGDRKYLFEIKPEKLNIVINMDDGKKAMILSGNQSAETEKVKQSAVEEEVKRLVVSKLREFNMSLSSNQVTVVSLVDKSFTISNVEISDKKQKIFINFSLKDPFTEALNIEIKTADGVMPLGEDKKVLLQNVAPTVVEFYNKAFYSKVDKFVEESQKK